MDLKQLLKLAAAFGAGTLVGKTASDRQRKRETFAEQFDPKHIKPAIEWLNDKSQSPNLRFGCARFLLVMTTERFRFHLSNSFLREELTEALTRACSDSHPQIAQLARESLERLRSIPKRFWDEQRRAQTHEYERLNIQQRLEWKLERLKDYVRTSPSKRQRIQKATEKETSAEARDFISKDRFEMFAGVCIRDLKEDGKTEEQLKEFLTWLAQMPDWQRDALILFSTEVDPKGEVRWIPGFVHIIEELRNQ